MTPLVVLVRRIAGNAVLAIVIGILVWLCIAYTRISSDVSLVWVTNGIMVGLLILVPKSLWVELIASSVVGAVAARLFEGDTPGVSLGLTLANAMEYSAVAAAIRWSVPDVRNPVFQRRLGRVATSSVLVSCACSATIAIAVVGPDRWTWLNWFGAHVLGTVVIGTLTVVVAVQRKRLLGLPGNRRAFVLGLMFLAITTFAAFTTNLPILFLVFVPQLWLTFQQGWRGVVFGTLLIGAISIASTIAGSGPFSQGPSGLTVTNVWLIQLFIGVMCMVTWPIAISRTQRAHLATGLRRSEAMYRLLAGNLRDLVVHLRSDGARLYIADSVTEMIGWSPAEMLVVRRDIVHPDDLQMTRDAFARVFAGQEKATFTCRMLHKQGHYVYVEILARRVIPADSGALPELVYSGRDVTARVEAEHALVENERNLQSIADGVPAVIVRIDTNGQYTFANARAGVQVGVDPKSLIGRSLRGTVGEATHEVIAPYVAAALCGERITFERETEGQDGERHYYETTYIPDIDFAGAVNGFFSLSYDITERKLVERTLEQLVHMDPLTGLANRRQFESKLFEATAQRQKDRRPISLFLIDVDHFKSVNDTHGHAVGDLVLRAIAQRLRSAAFDFDLVGRLGGDEFAILINGTPTLSVVQELARRIIAAMRRPIVAGDVRFQVGLSVGVAYSDEAIALDDLMVCADRALYAAKESGRNSFVVFSWKGGVSSDQTLRPVPADTSVARDRRRP